MLFLFCTWPARRADVGEKGRGEGERRRGGGGGREEKGGGGCKDTSLGIRCC